MPRTVRVPDRMASVFQEAERVVGEYFRDRHDDPTHGTLEIQGERYVLVRAASLSVEFFRAVGDLFGEGKETEAAVFARNILFDLAHSIGRSDARNFHRRMGLVDPIARLSAGPVHFAHTGWAFVDVDASSRPAPDDSYYLLYDHPHSFEADAWLASGRGASFPVCVMNAGYSSGWCQESFDVKLVATEILCRARGDEHCRFIMAPPERVEAHVRSYVQAAPELAARIRGYEIPDFFSRKRLEDELRRARDELEVRVEERTEALREANARLQEEMAERARVEDQLLQSQKLRALGRLAGGVAHDFNNLLTVIQGYAELAASDLPQAHPVSGHVAEISRAAVVASELTSQLLAFSRQQVVAPRVLDLNEVVVSLAALLERLIGEDVRLEVGTDAEPCPVEADPGQIEQVVVNLAANARDAMPSGGTLSIAVSNVSLTASEAKVLGAEPGPTVRLAVSDTGAGMEPETLQRVFEPFFTTKAMGRGTGLGLATVYGIVEQSGGVVGVESAPGRGTTFEVYLPARVGEAVERRAASQVAAPARPRATILLVEDEDTVRELVRTVLQRHGHTVLAAASPDRALELFEGVGDQVDLLLSDVIMPGMSGGELARRLKAKRPALKTLFMSGYTDDAVGLRGALDPGVTLVQKPFTLEDLSARVEEVLRE